MAAIGTVVKDDTGTFKGQLRTISIKVDVTIVPNDTRTSDTQPHFRVMAGSVEIGAGWNRRSQASGRSFVSLALAAPEFGPRRIYANLVEASDGPANGFVILWSPDD